MQLYQGDCLEVMRDIPDGSVDMVLTDPPYNIGVTTKKGGKDTVNNWDKIDGYITWCLSWLMECQRVLRPNGVLYFWHNDIKQIAELLETIKNKTEFDLVSFCIWDKGSAYRARTWQRRDPDGKTALRSWFNICEYCLYFIKSAKGKYKATRNYHRCDDMHCNIWHVPPVPSNNRLHTCQKPVQILERLCRVSCRPGGTVLDCFMGSGSTGVACVNTGRDFIGIELDKQYFETAQKRIEDAESLIRFKGYG